MPISMMIDAENNGDTGTVTIALNYYVSQGILNHNIAIRILSKMILR